MKLKFKINVGGLALKSRSSENQISPSYGPRRSKKYLRSRHINENVNTNSYGNGLSLSGASANGNESISDSSQRFNKDIEFHSDLYFPKEFQRNYDNHTAISHSLSQSQKKTVSPSVKKTKRRRIRKQKSEKEIIIPDSDKNHSIGHSNSPSHTSQSISSNDEIPDSHSVDLQFESPKAQYDNQNETDLISGLQCPNNISNNINSNNSQNNYKQFNFTIKMPSIITASTNNDLSKFPGSGIESQQIFDADPVDDDIEQPSSPIKSSSASSSSSLTNKVTSAFVNGFNKFTKGSATGAGTGVTGTGIGSQSLAGPPSPAGPHKVNQIQNQNQKIISTSLSRQMLESGVVSKSPYSPIGNYYKGHGIQGQNHQTQKTVTMDPNGPDIDLISPHNKNRKPSSSRRRSRGLRSSEISGESQNQSETGRTTVQQNLSLSSPTIQYKPDPSQYNFSDNEDSQTVSSFVDSTQSQTQSQSQGNSKLQSLKNSLWGIGLPGFNQSGIASIKSEVQDLGKEDGLNSNSDDDLDSEDSDSDLDDDNVDINVVKGIPYNPNSDRKTFDVREVDETFRHKVSNLPSQMAKQEVDRILKEDQAPRIDISKSASEMEDSRHTSNSRGPSSSIQKSSYNNQNHNVYHGSSVRSPNRSSSNIKNHINNLSSLNNNLNFTQYQKVNANTRYTTNSNYRKTGVILNDLLNPQLFSEQYPHGHDPGADLTEFYPHLTNDISSRVNDIDDRSSDDDDDDESDGDEEVTIITAAKEKFEQDSIRKSKELIKKKQTMNQSLTTKQTNYVDPIDSANYAIDTVSVPLLYARDSSSSGSGSTSSTTSSPSDSSSSDGKNGGPGQTFANRNEITYGQDNIKFGSNSSSSSSSVVLRKKVKELISSGLTSSTPHSHRSGRKGPGFGGGDLSGQGQSGGDLDLLVDRNGNALLDEDDNPIYVDIEDKEVVSWIKKTNGEAMTARQYMKMEKRGVGKSLSGEFPKTSDKSSERTNRGRSADSDRKGKKEKKRKSRRSESSKKNRNNNATGTYHHNPQAYSTPTRSNSKTKSNSTNEFPLIIKVLAGINILLIIIIIIGIFLSLQKPGNQSQPSFLQSSETSSLLSQKAKKSYLVKQGLQDFGDPGGRVMEKYKNEIGEGLKKDIEEAKKPSSSRSGGGDGGGSGSSSKSSSSKKSSAKKSSIKKTG